MNEILRLGALDLNHCKDVFGLCLPSSDIKPVGYNDLPKGLQKQMDSEENCGLTFKVLHIDNSTTYVSEFVGFDLFFFQDRNAQNRYTGEGRIYVESGEESEIPVVGYTWTSEKFRKQGLGRRRLFIMNATSKARYDNALSSSGSPRISQRSIWEKLVKEGIAETHVWEGTQRYRFIT